LLSFTALTTIVVTKHHRFLLRLHLNQIDALDAAMATVDAQVEANGIFALISICGHPAAWANDASGKNCRMEQQCHWENFKKICTWVKVCR